MNLKSVGIALLTVLIIAFAWKISQDKAPQTEIQRSELLPGLLEQLNQVDRLSLTSSAHTTVLKRSGENWVLENKDNFPANGADVRRALLQLAGLRSVEAKTAESERYAKLGVEDVDQSGATGTLVEGTASDGSTVLGLIVGNRREAASRDQYYVRRPGEAQSWLAEGALDVPADPIRWLDALICDIDTARVREVRITVPEQPVIAVSKDKRSDNFFELHDVPAGFVAKSKAIVSSMGAVLLDLRFNDVAAASRVAGQTPKRSVEVRTFDGMVVTMDEYELGEEPYMGLRFTYDEALVVAEEPPAAVADSAQQTPPVAPIGDATGTDDDAAAPKESVADEAARLQARNADWVYVLPNYKRRMIERDLASLIKTPEAENETPTQ